MKQLIQDLINEINAYEELDYYLTLEPIYHNEKFYRIDFFNKKTNKKILASVVGNLLHLQYYLLGMKKYKTCLPF